MNRAIYADERGRQTRPLRSSCLAATAVAYWLASSSLVGAEGTAARSLAEWRGIVEKNAPAAPTAPLTSGRPRRVLVFSLFTGFHHTVVPYVDEVFRILGSKSGAFETTVSRDIESLDASSLARYDVLVLNNNCSIGPRRNLLLDELERNPRYQGLSPPAREARASQLEQSMLRFVRGGGGLVVIHGAPTLLNNSPQFTDMVGGAFDYHPRSQQLTLRPVEPDHPLLAAFQGKPFVHRDEPYCFWGAYAKKSFRPLLAIDPQGIDDGSAGKFGKDVRYAAWIKRYGAGRVFYCLPGHYEASYESPIMLRFLLDGTQYAAGDLACDDRKLGDRE